MTRDEKHRTDANQSLLGSLNRVAASLLLSIQSEADIYRAFTEGIADLGLRGGISRLDDSGTSLSFQALGYSNQVLKAIKGLEKLAGVSAPQFSVKLDDVEIYHKVIETRKAIFTPTSTEIIRQILGRKLRKVASGVTSTFSDVPVIYAALHARGKALGIVNIAGPSLTQDDIPAVESFALQLSIALDNARLFSALMASEQTYRTLISTSPDSVTMTDLTGTIIYASPQAVAMHGAKSADELMGMASLELIAPEDRERAMEAISEAIQAGVVRNVEYTLLRLDGSRFTGEVNAALIRDAMGEPSAFIASVRDIMERKRLEETYRGLVDQDLMGFIVIQDGRIVFANSAMCESSGYEVEELLGLSPKQVQEMIHLDDREMVWGNFRKRITGEDVIPRYSYRAVRKDGSIRWLEMVATRTMHDGKPAIQGAILDITDRVIAQEAIRESEVKLRDIFTNVSDILYFHDLEGNFIEANLFYKREMGYSEDEIRKLRVPDLIPERYRHEYKGYIEQLIKDGRAHGLMRLMTKDGEERILEYRNTLVCDDTGPAGVRGSARDITERIRIERDLRESEERYRHFLTNFQGIAFRVGPDELLRPIFLHGRVEEICGYTIPELMSGAVTWIGILHPDDRKRAVRALKGMGEDPQASADLETRIVRKDGEIRWVRILIQNVSSKGISGGVHGAIYDVTHRTKADEKLRISEERYRSFVEGFQGIAYRSHMNFVPEFMHGSVEEITGYTEAELVAGTPSWDKVIHPEDLEALFTEDERKLHTVPNHSYVREYRIVCKDGTIRHVRDYIRNTCDASGKPHMLQGALYDVTDRVSTQRKLRVSEERYRSLVDNLRVGVYRTTAGGAGLFYHANPAMAEIFGYDSPEDIMTAKVEELYQNPHERKAFLDEVMARGSVQDREFLLQKKDGTPFWASVTASAKFGANGEIEWLDGVVEDITERKKAEEMLLRDAFYDELTNLPNRALLIDRLDRAIERSKRREDYHCAVLFMDLDRFKVVNDSLGHALGDQLLVSVAGRLGNCLRSGDTVARLGGDEFVVLLEELKELSQATAIADRIREELNRPHSLNGQVVYTSGSIGIVMTVQGYGEPADVLRDADIAMYGAKLAGKDRYQIFDPSMHELALTRLQIETELRQAMANQELRVHYQPILNMETGRLFGFEALMRWEHPQRGLVSPVGFLPIMEETGLIIQAGRWLMMEACKQTRQWNRKYREAAPLTISVNLSGREFSHPDLQGAVRDILVESKLDPELLTLEITEGVIMSDPDQARRILEGLGNLGVQIHLDDFGTGYSSLGKLGQFKIDKLKIDRTFIQQIENGGSEIAIVETILHLAKNLAMAAIAEGVETKAQYDYLRENECQYCQGYYIAKPMSESHTENFITLKARERKRARQL